MSEARPGDEQIPPTGEFPRTVPDTVAGVVPPELRGAPAAPPIAPPVQAGYGVAPPAAPPAQAYPPPPYPPSAPAGSPYGQQPYPGIYATPPRPVDRADRWQQVSKQSWDFIRTHSRRALARDMRSIQPTAYEEPILTARGVQEVTVRQYLAWRRSWLYFFLLPATISAIFHLITIFETDWKIFTGFGAFLSIVVQLLQASGFVAAAFLAAWWWDNHRRSQLMLLLGFATSFLLPIAFAILPLHWFLDLGGAQGQALAMQKEVIGLLAGMAYFVTLLPTVLSLLPGVLRACVRIKSLLPESIVPGWFLVVAAPIYALILMLAFIAVNQAAGNALLILGMLLLMGAPAVYLYRTPLFIRPLMDQRDRGKLDQLQVIYVAVAAAGFLMLLIYFANLQLFGHPLVGDEGSGAFITTGRMLWEATKFAVNYIGRSMFITAVAVDVFMLVNLSVWRNTKAFSSTPEAEGYDRLMTAFDSVASSPAGKAFEVG
jgi:hypothetical protein